MIRILLRCFSVLLPSWAMLVTPAWGQQQRPMLHELVLTQTDHEVLLYLHLQGGFQQEILEAIESGIPITLTYHIRLYRKRGLWFNEEVLSKVIKHIVKYDTLKRQYRVSEINGLFSSVKITKHELTMVRWMSAIEGQPLIPFHLLQPGEEYSEGGAVALSAQSHAVSRQSLGHGNSLDLVESFHHQSPPITTLGIRGLQAALTPQEVRELRRVSCLCCKYPACLRDLS